nr:MAG TPA: hypothetical protein [Caudoviricetes sp.]
MLIADKNTTIKSMKINYLSHFIMFYRNFILYF